MAPDMHPDPVCLHDGALHLLGDSVAADGRLSWYPPEDDGRCVPFNSYLLSDGDSQLLVEAGVPAVLDATLAQLRQLLGPEANTPNVAVTRNEPDCVANIPHLVRRSGLRTVNSPGLMNTLQYFPADDADLRETSFTHRSTELQMLNFGVRCVPAAPGGRVRVSDERSLEVVAVPLRVLPTVWYYDVRTRTMFCSDTFSDETAASPETRILTAVEDEDALVARFRRNFDRKFDWLARSDLTSVLTDLEGILARYEIETLAPNRGVVIHGRIAVAAKTRALMATLRALHAA